MIDEPEDIPADVAKLLEQLDNDDALTPEARQLSDGLRELYEHQADTDRHPLFDAAVAEAMRGAAHHEDSCVHMRQLGERMAALYCGMLDGGLDDWEDATMLVANWMECAVFQRIARDTGTFGM